MARVGNRRRVALVLVVSFIAPFAAAIMLFGGGPPSGRSPLTIQYVEQLPGEPMSNRVFVLIRGAQTNALIFGQHENLFARYGRVRVVDPDSRSFNARAVVRGAINSIPADADEIVFVGISMGGLVG